MVCGALVTAFGLLQHFVVPIVAMAVLTALGFYMKNLETHEARLDVLSVLLFRRGADRVVVRFDAADHRRCSQLLPPGGGHGWCSWCASCDARIRRSSVGADEESRVLAGAHSW